MRRLARTGLAVLGLALATPTGVWADPPSLPGLSNPAPGSPMDLPPGGPLNLAPSSPASFSPAAPTTLAPTSPKRTAPRSRVKAKATVSKSHKHRRGLFGTPCKCVDCQRAAVLAKDGVHVPPPPGDPNMMMSESVVVAGKCATCEAQAGTVVMQGPVTVVEAGNMPGRAVVGGQAPGYAVVGEQVPMSEPAPVGVVSARLGGGMPQSNFGGPAAPRDTQVMTSSIAPSPVRPPGHNRPHVISHLLGIEAIGKRQRQARERAKEAHHASIPYGPQAEQVVTDLPASVVYGRGGR